MFKALAVAAVLVAVSALASETPLRGVYELSFKVTDAEGKHVLLDSNAALDLRSSQRFNADAAGSNESVEMIVSATPADDGTVVLRFDWAEKGSEGRRVVWSPRLAMTRNSSGTAKVRWGTDGRTLEVKLK